jgi:branched-chain amino acid transport system permease protein
MESFLQQVFAGVASGAVYASLGVGLVMIYRATGHLNFAQGEVAMVGTFVTATLITLGAPYWLAMTIAVVASFVFGAGLWSYVVKPVSRVSHTAPIAALIGVFLVLNSAAGLIWGHDTRPFPSPFEHLRWLGNRFLSPHETGTVVSVLLVAGMLHLFFHHTRLGTGMRACAENAQSSHLVGIQVDRMLSAGWGISTALGALAGVLVAPIIYLEPNMMAGVLIYGFAAALLGGISSPLGAVAGGLIVGVAENLIGFYLIGTEIKLSTALLLIIAILLFKPAGLFGVAPKTRV